MTREERRYRRAAEAHNALLVLRGNLKYSGFNPYDPEDRQLEADFDAAIRAVDIVKQALWLRALNKQEIR